MTQWNTVAIVGVGLLGGSIGLALRDRGLAREVVGVGRNEANLRTALQMGAVDNFSTELSSGVSAAELTIVCTPVSRIAADVRDVAAACPPGALITDVGSTKEQILAAAPDVLPRGVRFVGSHPLAGKEKSGCGAASNDLFQDRLVIVTPSPTSSGEDLATIEAFWQSLGARVTRMSPQRHDSIVARTSHLPHLIAAALAAVTPPDAAGVVASGWLDTTRVAAGDAAMWRDIFLSNQDAVLAALDDYETMVADFRRAIKAGDGPRLIHLLAQAKDIRDALGS